MAEYIVVRSDDVMLLTTDLLDAFNVLYDLKDNEDRPCYLLGEEGGYTYAYR